MTDHKYGTAHADMSENEEMYLVTTAQLAATLDGNPVPLSRLAKELEVQPVSVNQMVRKLAEIGLLDYLPYKGVQLTADGRRLAQRVLRSRQLWHIFLSTHLNLAYEEADALACRMEHITPDSVAEQLANYLEEPRPTFSKARPEGDLHKDRHQQCVGLESLNPGVQAQIVGVEGPANTVNFLIAEGFEPDSLVTIAATGHDGALLCSLADHICCLTPAVAAAVTVRTIDSPTNRNGQSR